MNKQYLIKPLITEKTMALVPKGWYSFAVVRNARKREISQEIGKQYSVQVTQIRTVTMPGKTRRVGKRSQSVQASDWKKALVRLKTGQHIDAFDSSQEGKTK